MPRPQELAHGASLFALLAHQWPTYVGYFTSFLTILIMWLNHHRLFTHIRKIDHTFLLLNGLLLLTVSTVPFPTSLVAAFMNHEGAHAASSVYSGLCILLAMAYNALWRYGSTNGRLLAQEYDADAVESITRQYRFGPALYVVAFIVSFFNGYVSVLICMGLAVFFALPPRKP